MHQLVVDETVCSFNEWPFEVKAGGICTACLPSGVIKNIALSFFFFTLLI